MEAASGRGVRCLRVCRSPARYALELDGVARHFGALVALSGVNMRIAAGERRAVLGSNGAGKTTLFNAITGDFLPTAGRIRFFGEDITTLPVHERIRRGLRRTYQISQLFGGLSVRRFRLSRLPRRLARPFRAARGRAADDRTMMQAESIVHAVHLESLRDHAGRERSVTASSGSSRSRSRSPARRASSCSTSRRPACRRPSAATSSPSSTRCRSISATSSSSTISTSRCALPNTSR